MQSKRNFAVSAFALTASAIALTSTAKAQIQDRPEALSAVTQHYRYAVGSWFGRAVPVAGQTLCAPGSAGCAVPAEIIMVFTIHGDGTFVGIDSNIFAGGSHSTAHGQWVPSGPNSVHATFTLLQQAPNGVFLGGFKNLFDATVVDPNTIPGQINAFLYLYTTPERKAIVDAEGLPTPSPLGAPSASSTTPGCVPLGKFTFRAHRVDVQQ